MIEELVQAKAAARRWNRDPDSFALESSQKTIQVSEESILVQRGSSPTRTMRTTRACPRSKKTTSPPEPLLVCPSSNMV